jgi:hypothetical protein
MRLADGANAAEADREPGAMYRDFPELVRRATDEFSIAGRRRAVWQVILAQRAVQMSNALGELT